MAWGNLKQISLADALVSTHPALEELDKVFENDSLYFLETSKDYKIWECKLLNNF